MPFLRKKYKIYALIDPRDKMPRFVGSTLCSTTDMIGFHVSRAELIPEDEKGQWISSLLKEGLRPIAKVLERSYERKEAKRRWIRKLSFCPLLNKNLVG